MSKADKFNVSIIKSILAKRKGKVPKIPNEAELINRMIQEDKEYLEVDGITYHLGRDVKEYLKKYMVG